MVTATSSVTYLNGQHLSDEHLLPGLKLALSEVFE